MATSVWFDSKASIILLPSGEQGEALLKLVENWAEVGILSTALWVRPEQVQKRDSAPPVITATVIGMCPDRTIAHIDVDLFEQLARENLDIIRLIKVRSATPSRASDELQDEIVSLIDNYMTYAMPAPDRKLSDVDGQLDQFQVITLIACSTEFTAKQRLTQQQRGHGIVVLASPEDRSSPWATDAFVRDSNRFLGFVLMHISTLGGLWNGLSTGTLELLEGVKPTTQGVWVSRAFFSGVLTDGLARRVAAEVIQEAATPSAALEASPPGTVFIEDQVSDEYVDWIVAEILDSEQSMLRYRTVASLEDPNQKNSSILQALKSYFDFAGNKFIQIPKWAWRWTVAKSSRKVQASLHGSDGVAVVNIEVQREQLDYRDRLIFDKIAETERLFEQSVIDLRAPVSLGQTRSTPSLWRNMRQRIFASLDGGLGLSGNGFPEIESQRPIFRTVASVMPSEQLEWSFPEGYQLPDGMTASFSWENLEDSFEIEKDLQAWEDLARNSLDFANAKNSELVDLQEELQLKLQAIDDDLRANGGYAVDAEGNEKLLTISQASGKPRTSAMARKKAEVYQASEEDITKFNLEAEALVQAQSEAISAAEEPVTEETATDNEPVEATVDEVVETTPDAEVTPADVTAAEEPKPEIDTAPESPAESAEVDEPASNKARATPAEPEAPEVATVDLVALLRERRALVQEINSNKSAQADALEIALRETQQFEERAELKQLFLEWRHEVERSIVWKLRASMRAESDAARRDVEAIQNEVETLERYQPNVLVEARKNFHKKLLIAWPITALVTGLVVLASQSDPLKNWLLEHQYNNDAIALMATAIGLGISLLIYLGVAVSYHKAWSHFQRKVDTTYTHLSSLSERYVHGMREENRLKVLHRQARDWLGLIGTALNRPWSPRPSWLESSINTLQTDALPFAMHVAQAKDDDQASRAILRSRADRTIGIKGWREVAFERLITEIGRVSGKSKDVFSVEALDNDLPHATNGSRDIVIKHMGKSEVLENVALTYLRPIISDLQTNAMSQARPPVIQDDDNPLEPLRVDIEGIDTNLKEEKWDAFLSHTLTRGNGKPDTATPLSTLIMSEAQIMTGAHEDVHSFALLPEHVSAKLPDETLKSLYTKTYDSSAVRPLDAVVRVDIIGPLDETSLRLWDGLEQHVVPERRIVETKDGGW